MISYHNDNSENLSYNIMKEILQVCYQIKFFFHSLIKWF